MFLFVFYKMIIFAAKISVVGFQSHSVALWILISGVRYFKQYVYNKSSIELNQ